MEIRNIEIFEDNNGNMCIQGGARDLLELIHNIMSAITNEETTQLLIPGRKLFINNKDATNESCDSDKKPR